MKRMLFKKIAATLTAFCMSACLMAPLTAFAAEGDCSITIKDSTVSVVGKTFNAYKLFDVTKGVVQGVTPTKYTYSYSIVAEWKADIIDALGLTDTPTDEEIIEAIEDLDASEAAAFANALSAKTTDKTVTKSAVTNTTTDKQVTLDLGANPGYYLIVDTSSSNKSAPILVTTTDETTEVKLKTDTYGIEKKIYIDTDKDGNVDKDTELFDSSTASIGDTVQYYISATVPDTSAYTTYTYKMTDTFDAGLDYITNSLNISLIKDSSNETLPDTCYTATYTANTRTLVINFNEAFKTFLEDDNGEGKNFVGGEIIARYTATVNKNAVVGTSGNENAIKLEYSNNPSDSSKTETTPEDVVSTYLASFNISKVDGDDEPLSGAGFTLYSDPACTEGKEISLVSTGNTGEYRVCTADETGVTEITTETSGKLVIKGLAAGTYYVKETKVPDGYNGITDVITMELVAKEDNNAIPDNAIEHDADYECEWTYSYKVGSGNATTGNTIEVVNKVGELLPDTGGMGTRVFTVCGFVLAAGAASLWIVKRKVTSK